MADRPIIPMVKISKDLRASLRPALMKDFTNSKEYYWEPEMGGLGSLAKDEVKFANHKGDVDRRKYISFFEWLVKGNRVYVVKEKKDERKEDISKGTSLFG